MGDDNCKQAFSMAQMWLLMILMTRDCTIYDAQDVVAYDLGG
jgi:hypothetical protein